MVPLKALQFFSFRFNGGKMFVLMNLIFAELLCQETTCRDFPFGTEENFQATGR